VCTDFKMLKVKVSIIFFGTQGFPARRDGRYSFSSFLIPALCLRPKRVVSRAFFHAPHSSFELQYLLKFTPTP
jgi:hypothetical protein